MRLGTRRMKCDPPAIPLQPNNLATKRVLRRSEDARLCHFFILGPRLDDEGSRGPRAGSPPREPRAGPPRAGSRSAPGLSVSSRPARRIHAPEGPCGLSGRFFARFALTRAPALPEGFNIDPRSKNGWGLCRNLKRRPAIAPPTFNESESQTRRITVGSLSDEAVSFRRESKVEAQ